MIDELLDELAARLDALGVRGEWQRRMLAEGRDHLELAADEDEGEAIRRFGDVDQTARLVAAELATASTRSATYGTFGALALTGLAYAVALDLVRAAGGWADVTSGPFVAVGPIVTVALVLLPQIAFVSGCLALIRALRTRRAAASTDAELSLLRRRSAVALGAGGGTVAALAVFAAISSGALASWWVWGTAAACIIVAVPLAAAAARLVRSGALVALPDGEPGDVFEDFALVFALPPVRRLALPDHPWRMATVVAGAVGLVGLAGGWYAEGDPGSGIVRGGFEALVLLVCFAVLGRTLGLRQAKR